MTVNDCQASDGKITMEEWYGNGETGKKLVRTHKRHKNIETTRRTQSGILDRRYKIYLIESRLSRKFQIHWGGDTNKSNNAKSKDL